MSSARLSSTVFGATAFNAENGLSGIDFSEDSQTLVALAGGDPVRLVAFALPDGAIASERVIEDSWSGLRVLPGGEVLLWEFNAVRRLSADGTPRWTVPMPDQSCRTLAVSRDGSVVATSAWESDAQIWDGGRGTLLHKVATKDGDLFALALSSTGDVLATGSAKGVIRLFDTRTGASIATCKTTKVIALAFSRDGARLLAGHGTGRVSLWVGKTLKSVPGFRGAHAFPAGGGAGCRWVAFSPDGTRAYSRGNELRLRTWTVPGGDESEAIQIPARHASGGTTALSPDGAWLAAGSTQGALSVWPTGGGALQVRVAAPSPVLGLALTPQAVAAVSNAICVFWDRRTGAASEGEVSHAPADVRGLSSGDLVRLDYHRIFVGKDLGRNVPLAFELGTYASGPLAISRDETRLAACAQETAEVWDLGRRARVASIAHADRVRACAFGPDDAWLATADQALHLWRLGKGAAVELIRDIPLSSSSGDITVCGLAVSDRGWIAVSIDESSSPSYAECSVQIVDPRSGEIVHRLDRPGVRLGQVAFVGGTRVVVTDSSAQLLVIDAAEGRWLDGAAMTKAPANRPYRTGSAAHPIAVLGNEVAHVRPDGNIAVTAFEAVPPEDGAAFLLEAARRARPAAAPMFDQRLVGHRFWFAGRFEPGTKDLRALAIGALGGTVASKADAQVTHVVTGVSAASTGLTAVKARGAAVLTEAQLLALLLPTEPEAHALLRGEVARAAERWNTWRLQYQGPRGERFPAPIAGIDLAGFDLREHKLAVVDLTGARLGGANLAKLDLFDTVFRNADLRGANLSGTSCYRTVFADAKLTGARLDANLSGAHFEGADLRDTDLRKADLTYAHLRGADLRGAQLPATLEDISHDDTTRWPKGYAPPT